MFDYRETLKRYWPTIPLALFLAVAIFFEWSSANAPRPIKHSGSDQQTTNRPVNNDPSILLVAGRWIGSHHDAIEAASAIGTAIFTVALFGANLLLWIVTRTAANAAKKAADAANVSAKAVAIVERAYVYPVIIGHGAVEECIKSALVFYDEVGKEDVPALETAEITYRLKNFGKTPAIVKTAFVGFGVATVGALIGVSITESVLASLEETGPLVSQMQVGITRKQAQNILAYTAHVCFEGNVTFVDIWGNEHTTDFYFVWDKSIRRMALRGVRTKTKQKGEQSYNES
jgi:hypothetical protein